jgi:hypothetical protein
MVGDGAEEAGAVGVGVGAGVVAVGPGIGDDGGELEADPVSTGAGEPAMVPGDDGGTVIGGVDAGADPLAGDGREALPDRAPAYSFARALSSGWPRAQGD